PFAASSRAGLTSVDSISIFVMCFLWRRRKAAGTSTISPLPLPRRQPRPLPLYFSPSPRGRHALEHHHPARSDPLERVFLDVGNGCRLVAPSAAAGAPVEAPEGRRPGLGSRGR